ncbi:MAG: hypothetical protein ABEN55_06125, partial [Bradymonadaceae bacterium]
MDDCREYGDMDDRWWMARVAGARTRRWAVSALIAVAVTGIAAGCYVDPEVCETDSDCFRAERCRLGTCRPVSDVPTLDTDSGGQDTAESDTAPDTTDTAGDSGRMDTRVPDTDGGGEDGGDGGDGCTPPSKRAFCQANGSPCETVSASDRCGRQRQVDCRPFAGSKCTCDYKGQSKGVCADQPFANGTCKKPTDYEEGERSTDSRDNDCDGYIDEVFEQLSMADVGDVVCGIKSSDDSVLCWNEGLGSVASKAPSGRFQEVSTAKRFACAIDDSDQLTCWGKKNISGRIKEAPTNRDVDAVSVSASRGCVLETTGEAT